MTSAPVCQSASENWGRRFISQGTGEVPIRFLRHLVYGITEKNLRPSAQILMLLPFADLSTANERVALLDLEQNLDYIQTPFSDEGENLGSLSLENHVHRMISCV